MNAKYNEEVLCGWANENEVNEDAIRLANILKRKSTVQALPQLKYIHNKADTDHRKQMTNLKVTTKVALHRQSHKILKIKRQKTEGYDEQEELSPSFKNEKIYNVIRLEEPRMTISPYLTDLHLDGRYQRQSNHTEFEPRTNSQQLNQKNRQSEASTFSNTLQSKMNPIRSHEFIPQLNDQSESPKKYDSKYYVKLSTLEMVNDLRKQFRNDILNKFGAKICMTSQRQPKDQRNTTKICKKEVDIHERLNQRFRETFIKQDIFTKKRRKEKLQSKLDLNQPFIFSEHSIFNDKQSLQTKIQSLRSPQKGRLIVK